ncbi:HK97-gp10 family putative phage morphogenesis protein [Pseudovibrio sp. Tun.PSC04-5.I4]|uniref:HK97-gp10 family putative phage morphogenesis protein n=1 Tax=Pseudovibrio sp. Tun.PSC04-5.I4 TaxID=1798213 RepID=UPI0008911AFC|nr:HK97-gp10 family putative phage morphogenesis protein [Pseudovibrio sp. Tun.PSC04-5.I4]SDR19918.1 phage protein, HK97 gp10 family [Pseudovibrio sp. Tun.PSC04-5.I4]
MADGVKTSSNIKVVMARLRKIAPNVDQHIEKVQKKSSTELASMASSAAPQRSGQLSRSLKARKAGSDETFGEKETFKSQSGWVVTAWFTWHWIEFGTKNHSAQPFFFPAYRLIRKRHVGRMNRALNKAIKDALK